MALFWGGLSQVEGAAAPQQHRAGVSLAPGHKRWRSGLSDQYVVQSVTQSTGTNGLMADHLAWYVAKAASTDPIN